MMGLGDVLGPADGSDLANHPAMKQRLSLGTVHTHTPPAALPLRSNPGTCAGRCCLDSVPQAHLVLSVLCAVPHRKAGVPALWHSLARTPSRTVRFCGAHARDSHDSEAN